MRSLIKQADPRLPNSARGKISSAAGLLIINTRRRWFHLRVESTGHEMTSETQEVAEGQHKRGEVAVDWYRGYRTTIAPLLFCVPIRSGRTAAADVGSLFVPDCLSLRDSSQECHHFRLNPHSRVLRFPSKLDFLISVSHVSLYLSLNGITVSAMNERKWSSRSIVNLK